MLKQHGLLLPSLLWLIVVAATLFSRTLWPIDETRYASVAWEMWLRNDFLVPYLNGEPYSHKPPLLFWLIQFGWWVFGVNDWWPRLVPAVFALINLFLCAHLARRLWPDDKDIGALAVLLLYGSVLWLAFIGLLMFDMLVVFCVLSGMIGLVGAWRESGWSSWLIVGMSIGLGLLAKGPVILLHLLPVAVLAPWWATERRPQHWLHWYAGIGLSVVVGVVIALCWAIPAALSGGAAYTDAIFWGQTAGRVMKSFAHSQSWWWYLPLLPLMLFPWSMWLPVLRALVQVRVYWHDAGVRLCLAWMLPVLIGFSLISGKQPHYLLPLFAGFALLAAHNLSRSPSSASHWSMLPISLILAITGSVLITLPALHTPSGNLPEWISGISPFSGIVVVLVALALLGIPKSKKLVFRMQAMVIAMTVLMVVIHSSIMSAAESANNLRPIGQYLYALQTQGTSLAHLGKYHGQFHFIGCLEKPFAEIRIDQIGDWFERHPDGKLISYSNFWQPANRMQPEFRQPFRSNNVEVWGAAAITSSP